MTVFKQDLFNKLNRVSEKRIQPMKDGGLLDEAATGTALGKVATSLGRFMVYHNARKERLDSRQFSSATGILSIDFDDTVRRELVKFYRTDGTRSMPGSNYRAEIVPGFQLSREDFFKDGKGLSYVDVYKGAFEKWRQLRLGQAPGPLANQYATPVLDRVALAGRIKAIDYENKWSQSAIANAGNTVIRAYRDRLSKVKGFSESDFQDYVTALGDVYSSGSEYVDLGQLGNSYRLALGDLLNAGVTEAGTSADNEMALRVLALTPVRRSKVAQDAMAGLAPTDKAYLNAVKKGFSNTLDYAMGANPPTQADRLLPWAISQLTDKQLNDLTDRSLKAFGAQTKIARTGLDNRIQGLSGGLNSVSVREKGFREEFRQSVMKGLQDVDKLYPKEIYPDVNGGKKANLLAMSEALEFRNFMSNTPAYDWGHRLPEMMQQASARINAELGPGNKALAFGVLGSLDKVLKGMVSSENEFRKANPFEAIMKSRKDIKSLSENLYRGQYTSEAERGVDQAALRTTVLQQAAKMGIAPSFLTSADRAGLESMAKMGDSYAIFSHMQSLQGRYGRSVFYDFIVPEVTSMEGMPEDAKFSYFFREPNIGQLVISANKGATKNKELLAGSEVLKRLNTSFAGTFERSFWGGTSDWDLVDSHILDRVQNTAQAMEVQQALRNSVKNLAMARLVQGSDSDANKAIESSMQLIIRGFSGSPLRSEGIEWEGRRFIPPPQFTLSESMTEDLQGALRSPLFIEQSVVPRVVVGPRYENASIATGIPVNDLLVRTFMDSETSPWLFREDGIMLAQNFPDLGITDVVLDRETGTGVLIPYSDLPAIAAWWGQAQ